MTAGTPPASSQVLNVVRCRPGSGCTRCGVLPLISLNLSRFSSIPASCAIAGTCRTVFVEQPSAISTASAFSNASCVMMSRGLMPFSRSSMIAMPACFARRIACAGDSGNRAVAGQSHAERLGQAVHRVGREHARAGSASGTRGLLHLRKLILGHLAGQRRRRCPSNIWVSDMSLPLVSAGHHRPAADHVSSGYSPAPPPSACRG